MKKNPPYVPTGYDIEILLYGLLDPLLDHVEGEVIEMPYIYIHIFVILFDPEHVDRPRPVDVAFKAAQDVLVEVEFK